ncbi:hypothetical protein Tco_0546475 [Tanacetum coccineum]
MYGDHGALDSSGSVSRHSLWNNIIRELGTLSLIVLFGITAAPIKLVLLKKKVNDAGTKDNTASVQTKEFKIHSSGINNSWLIESPLMHVYPRLYALECDKQATIFVKLRDSSLTDYFQRARGIEEEQLLHLVDKIASVILYNSNDRWVWSIDSSGEFLVKLACSYIDDTLSPIVGVSTR